MTSKGIAMFIGSIVVGLVAGLGFQSYRINKLQKSIDATEQQLKKDREYIRNKRNELIAMTDMTNYIPEGFDEFLKECEKFLEEES